MHAHLQLTAAPDPTKVVPDDWQPSALTCSRSTALQKISGLSLWFVTAAAASASSLPRIMSHMCDSHSVDTCTQATLELQAPLVARVRFALHIQAALQEYGGGRTLACRGHTPAGRCM